MSPLLGSSGGSSEYAFRGTLDDWPVDFSTALAAQNQSGISPVTTVTATLTITGLNYKARVIVEDPNATVSVTSEFGVAVTDGREVYAPRKESDPPLFIRDQSVISIRLQPTSGTIADFLKTYTIPVKVGKRQAIWTVSTRAVDETPTSFIFNPLIDQQLGVTTTSNTITIAGLENGFSFPISVSPNQIDGNVTFFKNLVEFTGPSTVANGDLVYLSTLTPSSYATPRTFTAQVGTFTTSWGILTRNAVTTINPFSFTGISSANQLGFGYTSGFMTVSGADTGPKFPLDPTTWPTDPTALLVSRVGIGSFQILKPDGTLRYPSAGYQTSPTYAFNGDSINLKVSSSTSYNTTTSTTLNVSDKSATFNVTTRPAPIDTIPATFTFTNLADQPRGALVTSGPVTLSGMIAGATGTASLTSSSPLIGAQFNVNGGAWITPPATANVGLGDIIRLRMTTPISDPANGVTNSTATFKVDGIDTSANSTTPTNNPEGYTTFTGFQDYIWNVGTIARTCGITAFTFSPNPILNAPLSSDNSVSFTVDGYNSDCRMRVEVTSSAPTLSPNYNFTAVNGINLTTPVKVLNNVAPGTVVTLTVRASSSYITDVAATVTVTNNNTPDTVTPENTYSTSLTIRTVADTTPASITLNPDATTLANGVEIGSTFTLNWTTVNCTALRSVSWTPAPSLTLLNGTSSPITAPDIIDDLTYPISQPFTYTITAYANPSANNYSSFPLDTAVTPNLRYVTATTTVNVNQDTTPLFTPDQFAAQLNVTPSTLLTPNTLNSNTITVSSLTVPLTASINTSLSSSGASIVGSGANKTINSGSTIQLQVNAQIADGPVGYNSTTSAVVDFKDSVGNIKATRTFSVTTRSCITDLLTNVRYPAGAVSNYVDLNYYSNATYNLVGVTPPEAVNNLLVSQTPVAFNGTKGTLGDGTVLTWTNLIGYVWSSFTLNAQRPPTNTEIISVLDAIIPASYANTAALQTFITNFALTAPLRDVTKPILDSPCAFVINASGY